MMIVAVIPAFNEEKTINNIIRKTKKYVNKVIVVNDASTDSTYDIAKKAGATVINHKKNMGLGKSLRDGFDYALKINADIILTLDADGQHNPEEIPKFLNAIRNGYGVVIGERDLKKYPITKKIGNFFLNIVTNIISGTVIRDTESGFRAFDREALKKIYPYLRADRYEIASEIIFAVGHYNIKYTNVKVSSPVYVKGVTVAEGVKNFLYMTRRRKRNLKSYAQDFKYVLRKWLKRFI